MMCLASAWSGLVDCCCRYYAQFYILPWLVMGEEEMEQKPWLTRKFLMQTTLWAPVVLTSLYIILTLVILVSSIDAVQFNAHELYGAPFVMDGSCFVRLHFEKTITKAGFIGRSWYCTGFDCFGYSGSICTWGDANEPISEFLSPVRLHGLCFLPFWLQSFLLVLRCTSEYKLQDSQRLLLRLTLFTLASLTLIGHVFTTVLVDRGDATHRITLVRGEMVEVDGYGYVFEDIVLENEALRLVMDMLERLSASILVRKSEKLNRA